MQIIKKKLSVHELAKPVDEEVLEYIANNCTSDVRKLEGALNRLFAYTTMFNKEKINANKKEHRKLTNYDKIYYKNHRDEILKKRKLYRELHKNNLVF